MSGPAATTPAAARHCAGTFSGRGRSHRRRLPRFCSPKTRPTLPGSSASPNAAVRQGRLPPIRGRGSRRGEPRRAGTKAALITCSTSPRVANECDLRLRRRPRRPRRKPFGGLRPDRRSAPPGGRVLRRRLPGHPDGPGAAPCAPGVRRAAVEQAVLPLRRAGVARGRSRAAAAARRAAERGPQRRLAAPVTTATSSRCPTSGSIRGTRRGIWRST